MVFGHRTTIIFKNHAKWMSFERVRERHFILVRIMKFCLLTGALEISFLFVLEKSLVSNESMMPYG